MRKIMSGLGLAAIAATGLIAAPGAALAHGHGHGHGHHKHYRGYYAPAPVVVERRVYVERPVYRERYVERPVYRERYVDSGPRYRSCRSGGTTGAIIGGAAGALLGRELDGGRDRTTGTIVGAGAGALLGREIDRNDRC